MWFNGNQKFWESCWKFGRNLNFGRQTEQVCYLYLSCFLCSIFGLFIFSLWFKAFLNIIKDFLSILVEKYKYLCTTHTIQGKNSKKIKKCSIIRLHSSIGGWVVKNLWRFMKVNFEQPQTPNFIFKSRSLFQSICYFGRGVKQKRLFLVKFKI